MTDDIKLRRGRYRGKPAGRLRATWKENGKRISWNTGVDDETEAIRRAAGERDRRATTKVDGHTPAVPFTDRTSEPESPAPPGSNGHSHRPLADALARATPASSAPASSTDAGQIPERNNKRLYEVFGKAMTFLTEGTLQRACRWAGREPEEMDDDEQALVAEGWREKGQEWFGQADIGAWGKILLGGATAGVGMYLGGKPLRPVEKPATPAAPAGG